MQNVKEGGNNDNDKNKTTNDEPEARNNYHEPFTVALENELAEDRERIVMQSELILNTKPNRIDNMIIKNYGGQLKNPIGRIFKKYNIIEYKSPGDDLNITTYHITMAYMYLYQAYKVGNEYIEHDDYSITYIRHGKPAGLMKVLDEKGFDIVEYEKGIYHITKPEHPDMQIIVTREVSDEHIWLKCLSDDVSTEQAELLMSRIKKLEGLARFRAESVLDLMTRLNRGKEWEKGARGMGEFRDLFKEDFEVRDRKIEELSKQLQTKDEQLQSKDEQLQSKDEQLQSKDEQLQSKDEQLQSKNEQLQTKDEQLQSKDEQLEIEKKENNRLRNELEKLKKQLNRIAVL